MEGGVTTCGGCCGSGVPVDQDQPDGCSGTSNIKSKMLTFSPQPLSRLDRRERSHFGVAKTEAGGWLGEEEQFSLH